MTYEFTTIYLKSRKGVNLYLGIDDSNGNKIWVKNKNEAIFFDNEKEAADFGRNYFKRFNDWKLSSHEQVI